MHYLLIPHVAFVTAVLAAGGPHSRTVSDTVWVADTSHSSAEFDVLHMGISHVRGTIPIIVAQATIPGGQTLPRSVEATLDASRIDTHQAKRDADLRSDHWFDVSKYSTITFVSSGITRTSDTAFTIAGNLTIHGVTKPVTLQATYGGRGAGMRGEPHVAYTAVTTIDRRDFGMTGGGPVVGTAITISLAIEAAAR